MISSASRRRGYSIHSASQHQSRASDAPKALYQDGRLQLILDKDEPHLGMSHSPRVKAPRQSTLAIERDTQTLHNVSPLLFLDSSRSRRLLRTLARRRAFPTSTTTARPLAARGYWSGSVWQDVGGGVWRRTLPQSPRKNAPSQLASGSPAKCVYVISPPLEVPAFLRARIAATVASMVEVYYLRNIGELRKAELELRVVEPGTTVQE